MHDVRKNETTRILRRLATLGLSLAMVAARSMNAVEASPGLPAPPEWHWFVMAADAPEGDQPDSGRANREPTNVAGWLRWTISLDDPEVTNARITITGNATCSLYLNGQRLMKQQPLSESGGTSMAVGWEVQTLLRNGRNQIAVEAHGPDSGAIVGIAMNLNAGEREVSAVSSFRLTRIPPPVGWQQTDFNDRDWPEVRSLGMRPEMLPEPSDVVDYLPPATPAPRRAAPLRFAEGDHVVLVGATFIERAQLSEHLEATLAGTCGERRVTFRNLGWSADTAWSDSRGIFDAPEVGYLRLVEHIRAEEPTVAIVCYGQNEALTPGTTPEQFQQQLGQLLDELTASGIACVLLSPHELFPARPPLPSPSRFNPRIELFSAAAASAARARGLLLIDLFAGFRQQMRQIDYEINSCDKLPPETVIDNPASGNDENSAVAFTLAENGMHLTHRGYALASMIVRERLMMLPARIPSLTVDAARRKVLSADLQIRQTEWSADGRSVRFEMREPHLSPLPVQLRVVSTDAAAFRVKGAIGAGDSPQEFDVSLTQGSDVTDAPGRTALVQLDANRQYDELRSLIQRKNELYFHRWRPQNITYLYGFRKHEQGNNASDIARFDPFIRDLENQIHEQQQPRWRTVTVQFAE
jgi:hypothetical protein